jgi:hypothetical protein
VGLLTLSHRPVDAAGKVAGIWVLSVARAAGIESSRRRLRLLTPSERFVDAASRDQQEPRVERNRGLSSMWREVEGWSMWREVEGCRRCGEK